MKKEKDKGEFIITISELPETSNFKNYNYRNKENLNYQYWTKNLSLAKIGKLFGVSDTTIDKYMMFFNIPRRTISQAMKLVFSRPEAKGNLRRGCKMRELRKRQKKNNKIKKMYIEFKENNKKSSKFEYGY